MHLGNIALGITLADFTQRIKLFGAQQNWWIFGLPPKGRSAFERCLDRLRDALPFLDSYPAGAALPLLAGAGLISAILRRQSASESCGPETNVPLTFVMYQPDTTPSRSDSSILT